MMLMRAVNQNSKVACCQTKIMSWKNYTVILSIINTNILISSALTVCFSLFTITINLT